MGSLFDEIYANNCPTIQFYQLLSGLCFLRIVRYGHGPCASQVCWEAFFGFSDFLNGRRGLEMNRLGTSSEFSKEWYYLTLFKDLRFGYANHIRRFAIELLVGAFFIAGPALVLRNPCTRRVSAYVFFALMWTTRSRWLIDEKNFPSLFIVLVLIVSGNQNLMQFFGRRISPARLELNKEIQFCKVIFIRCLFPT